MESEQTSDAQAIEILRETGLTPSAAACYLYLASMPRPQTTAWIVEGLDMKPASLYRALRELEHKGFLHSSKHLIRGRMYYVEDLSRALDNYALIQRTRAQPLIQQLHDR